MSWIVNTGIQAGPIVSYNVLYIKYKPSPIHIPLSGACLILLFTLAGRWLKYRQDRSIEDQLRLQEEEMMEYEIEIKRQTYEDVAKYVQNQKNMKRVSLAYRLEKAKKDRDFDKGKQDLNKWLDIEEQRLRQQDRLDVEEYYKKIENARRVSLEYRNQLEVRISVSISRRSHVFIILI